MLFYNKNDCSQKNWNTNNWEVREDFMEKVIKVHLEDREGFYEEQMRRERIFPTGDPKYKGSDMGEELSRVRYRDQYEQKAQERA